MFSGDPAAVKADVRRAAVLRDEDFAPIPAVDAAISSLERNRRGYFLMVEWDMHTDDPVNGLQHVLEMDDLIRHVRARTGEDTLILFTADHSFALRMIGGDRASPYARQFAEASKPEMKPDAHPLINVIGKHSGEEVLVAASGPGAERLRGFIPNTALFEVIMGAFGWKPDRSS